MKKRHSQCRCDFVISTQASTDTLALHTLEVPVNGTAIDPQDPSTKTAIGYMLLTIGLIPIGKCLDAAGKQPHTKVGTIWFLYVSPPYQRLGFAMSSIESLKDYYDILRTQALSGQASRQLLLRCGFHPESDARDTIWVWHK